MKKTVIDRLFDENDTGIITLYNQWNEPVEFEQIAVIPYEEKVYAILQPVIMPPGANPDEALVFLLNELEDGEITIDLVKEEDIIDAIFDEYYALIADKEGYL